MNRFIATIQAFMLSRDGTTAIEYGMIGAGVSLTIMLLVFWFGDSLKDLWTTTHQRSTFLIQ